MIAWQLERPQTSSCVCTYMVPPIVGRTHGVWTHRLWKKLNIKERDLLWCTSGTSSNFVQTTRLKAPKIPGTGCLFFGPPLMRLLPSSRLTTSTWFLWNFVLASHRAVVFSYPAPKVEVNRCRARITWVVASLRFTRALMEFSNCEIYCGSAVGATDVKKRGSCFKKYLRHCLTTAVAHRTLLHWALHSFIPF